ncbi:MAG: LuxR C-terminal-related transcriptional regulator [Dehalococcoidia bacterium]|nr:LuxR C-terminal-related transcriptional regulator [Dehalococcoidia bacterium]
MATLTRSKDAGPAQGRGGRLHARRKRPEEELRQSEEQRPLSEALKSDGATSPAEVRGRPAPSNGLVARVPAVRDVVERKAAEEAMQRARQELEGKVERQMLLRNPYRLTFRELTVLHLVSDGRSDKGIGVELGISPLTAQKHISNILTKMDASCRTEACVRAVRQGLLD